MTFRIGKTFTFDAAHQLSELPAGHKCRRLHGHTYTVEVTVGSDALTGPGFVTDFADLDPFGAYLQNTLDHQNLNEVLPFPPTSEAIARHLAHWFCQHVQPGIPARLESVRVAETPRSWAEYAVAQASR